MLLMIMRVLSIKINKSRLELLLTIPPLKRKTTMLMMKTVILTVTVMMLMCCPRQLHPCLPTPPSL